MPELKEWMDKIKEENPDLADFVAKIEPLVSANGFNSSKFEKAVIAGLQKIENDVEGKINNDLDAQDKEDHD